METRDWICALLSVQRTNQRDGQIESNGQIDRLGRAGDRAKHGRLSAAEVVHAPFVLWERRALASSSPRLFRL